MGVDTRGYINSKVTAKEIFDVIVDKFDKNAKFDCKYEIIEGHRDGYVGFICFKHNENNRMLFVIENITCDSYMKDTMFNDNKYTYLSLGKRNDSIEIITEILKVFGGYLDEDDCDDIDPWETFIEAESNFEWSEYILKQNKIIALMDENIKMEDRVRTARIAMKHCCEIMDIMNGWV